MAITKFSGALVVGGQQPAVNGIVPDYNQNAAPSLAYDGWGLLDPRFGYYDSANLGYRALGFFDSSFIPTLDFVPFTATVNNIAAAQTSTAGTPLTLVSSSGSGITVLSVATQILPSGTILPAGTLSIDTAQNILQFGTSKDIGVYDPNTMAGRALILTNNASETSGTYLVKGWDIYGYPMTQLLTGPASSTVSTLKAFKYVGSITPAGTVSSTATTVGTTDTIGFPLQSSYWSDILVHYGTAAAPLLTAATGYTAAVTTNPSTNLLGDVRGTYALQSSSNNTLRFALHQTPRPTLLAGGTTAASITGLFGQNQV